MADTHAIIYARTRDSRNTTAALALSAGAACSDSSGGDGERVPALGTYAYRLERGGIGIAPPPITGTLRITYLTGGQSAFSPCTLTYQGP